MKLLQRNCDDKYTSNNEKYQKVNFRAQISTKEKIYDVQSFREQISTKEKIYDVQNVSEQKNISP